MEGHSQNVAAAAFHPTLPVILTASEDGTVRIWHSVTYRLQNTLNYGLDRAWSLGCLGKSGSEVAIGYDEGVVTFKVHYIWLIISLEKTSLPSVWILLGRSSGLNTLMSKLQTLRPALVIFLLNCC